MASLVLYIPIGEPLLVDPGSGGKVDRRSPTQFGRAMQQLGSR